MSLEIYSALIVCENLYGFESKLWELNTEVILHDRLDSKSRTMSGRVAPNFIYSSCCVLFDYMYQFVDAKQVIEMFSVITNKSI